jgi:hypothetical protein
MVVDMAKVEGCLAGPSAARCLSPASRMLWSFVVVKRQGTIEVARVESSVTELVSLKEPFQLC